MGDPRLVAPRSMGPDRSSKVGNSWYRGISWERGGNRSPRSPPGHDTESQSASDPKILTISPCQPDLTSPLVNCVSIALGQSYGSSLTQSPEHGPHPISAGSLLCLLIPDPKSFPMNFDFNCDLNYLTLSLKQLLKP